MVDEAAIQTIIQSLDQLVPKEGAKVELIDNLSDETLVLANRCGYLRLGIELLRSAFDAPSERYGAYSDSIPVDAAQLLESGAPLLVR